MMEKIIFLLVISRLVFSQYVYPPEVLIFKNQNPKLLQRIEEVESDNGKFRIGDDGKSLGVMMVTLEAYYDVIKEYPDLEAENPETFLMNDYYNRLIATCYLFILYKKLNDIDLAIIAYNAGIGTVYKYLAGQKYLNKVKKRKNR